MILAVDFGNTTVKAAFFREGRLIEYFPNLTYTAAIALANAHETMPVMACSVNNEFTHFVNLVENKERLHILDYRTPVPVDNRYESKETLGMDRLAAVCGAHFMYPKQDVLVIDAGTCITYDLLSEEGSYCGGSIAPGLSLRFKALNQFTAKLPLVGISAPHPLTGKTTEEAIAGGVINGLCLEIDGTIAQYRKEYVRLVTVMTGGDGKFFETKIKEPIFAIPELVLVGLNRIADFNGFHEA